MRKDHRQPADYCSSGRSFSAVRWRQLKLRHAALFCILGAVIATFTGCKSAAKLPDKSSKEYGDVVSAFYVGLAALQVGDDVHADSRLSAGTRLVPTDSRRSEVTRLVPAEPAGWANWGILALRQRNYDAAAQRLERARDLAPK